VADLTTKQVAERFGVLDATVRLWRRRLLFPNAYEEETPRGAVWKIPEEDLQGFEPPKKTGRPPKKASKKPSKK
jgi:hypothetical protein